ncbi:MAG: hypothetical protein K8R67_08330 [Desulfobacteraceae bacterium]|nr:hypothetical protein [Desulfobacteraceae bacterium]
MKKTIFILLGLSLLTLNSFAQEKTKIKPETVFNFDELQDIKELNAISFDSLSVNEQNASNIKFKANKKNYSINSNGTTYIILSSTKTTYRDCYKCLSSHPYCTARYLVESRKYTEWENGQVKRVWNRNVSVFMGCGRW